jgi:hypothetical protein
MAGKIFISYRHDDSEANPLGISQFLEQRFGRNNVFLDIDLKPGQKFASVLDDRLAACRVFLCLIGPRWLGTETNGGKSRLHQDDDWVRLEVERALERGITVIPVLVNGAKLPSKASLPVSMQPMLEHHAAIVTNANFRSDMEALASVLAERGRTTLRRTVVIGMTAAAGMAASAAYYFSGSIGPMLGASEQEIEQWRAAEREDLISAWQAYLDRWPAGAWATQAKQRIARRREHRQIRTLPGSEVGVTVAYFTPDGRSILTNSGYANPATRFTLFDAATGAVIRNYPGNIGVRGAPLMPDGKRLLVYGQHPELTIIRFDDELDQTPIRHGGGDWVYEVAFSPRADLSALACSDSTVRVRSGASLEREVAKLEGHTSDVWSVAFSPDGTLLLSGGDDGIPRLWDVSRLRFRSTLSTHAGRAGPFVFSLDGKTAYSGASDGLIRRFEMPSGQLKGQIKAHDTYAIIATTRTGRFLLSYGGDKTIKLWDATIPQWNQASAKELMRLTGHTGDVWTVVQSPDGRRLVSAGVDPFVRIWDVSDLSL